ncbi:MAG: (E)-4-hydroxy-3-methylbut-2-enyl-diphosphate synthase [Verrucomicrobia bacterium]|nr:(E)-4-hydroxy-3-methylbut-2-enyl-diphosphate synthase [Verrucomicrobiota bacterium]
MQPRFRSYPLRRPTREVKSGGSTIGGENPIRIQSMLTSDTMDTDACVKETLGLVEVGCEIVRITAPTVKDARNLENIRAALNAAGCHVPLVADIHFKPEAALEAARWVEKVRINPGNFADSKKFHVREYTDAEYTAEIGRIRERFAPLVEICKSRGIAMRIGTNHGSLSDRIMNRHGDTPLGMVESALEFARLAREMDYHAFVFSMKSSNPKVMIQAYRLLVARLDDLQDEELASAKNDKREAISWNYPIHLGVTEAGDSEDGRIKSAIGIGSLLADGIGDTIRVSLTEDSVHEIPVARALADLASQRKEAPALDPWPFDPFTYKRRESASIIRTGIALGESELVRVAVKKTTFDQLAHKLRSLGDYQPEIIYEKADVVEIDPRDSTALAKANASQNPIFVTIPDDCDLPVIGAYRLLASRLDPRHPILLKDVFGADSNLSGDFLSTLLHAATNIGSLLCDGIGDAVLIQGEKAPGQSLRTAYNTLQAAGVRIFKTDYVACPSCGRTLFNLQETTARIKAATSHLKGVKIAIMGCIVNGPGEMADADFGYVGGAPGKINLYVGKTPVKFNIPQADAVERLVDLIREHGRWIVPQTANH